MSCAPPTLQRSSDSQGNVTMRPNNTERTNVALNHTSTSTHTLFSSEFEKFQLSFYCQVYSGPFIASSCSMLLTSPFCIWLSCFLHLALRFWNHTCNTQQDSLKDETNGPRQLISSCSSQFTPENGAPCVALPSPGRLSREASVGDEG